jgi:hypothetical protein
MKTQVQIKNLADRQDTEQSLLMQTRYVVEKDFNSRLDELRGLVDKLGAVPHDVCLENTVQMCDRAQDLRVKVEAAGWMLQIANHLDGVGREMVISTIGKSLDDLERVVASEIHAKDDVVAA